MRSSQLTWTSHLLGLIGSPFVKAPENVEITDPLSLYRFAADNRVRFHCLSSLFRYRRSVPLEEEYSKLARRISRTLDVFSDVSQLLDDAGVEYAFFKSARPYKEATVDIDVLIFGKHHPLAVDALVDGGYSLLEKGPLSTTLSDETVPMNVDLYDEIGVSRIIYLDKDMFRSFVTTLELDDGTHIRSLDAKADLLAVVTHSVIKEQLYVLSEYFTTLGFLDGMNDGELDAFVGLARNSRARHAASTHLGITAFLHRHAHGFVPAKLGRVIGELGSSGREVSRLSKANLSTPHRYSTGTLARSLAEKLEEPKAKKSMVRQLAGLFDPRFNGKFFSAVIEHIVRKSY